MEYDIFLQTFLQILDKYAPMKKYIYIFEGKPRKSEKQLCLDQN